MTTFELAKRYMVIQCNKLAEINEYNWSDEFKLSYINEFFENFQSKDGYKHIDPNKLTKSQLMELGGSMWGEESNLVLIPLWMKYHLPPVFNGASIGGESEKLLKTSEIDNDHRFGCLAYGVFVD